MTHLPRTSTLNLGSKPMFEQASKQESDKQWRPGTREVIGATQTNIYETTNLQQKMGSQIYLSSKMCKYPIPNVVGY